MKWLSSVSVIGVSLMLAGCGPTAQQKAALNENQKLKERVKTLEEQTLREEEESRVARAGLRELREESTKKERESTAERETLKKQLDEVKKAYDAYRAKYRVTARASGQKLARLDCGDGKVFDNVEVTEVTPGELRFHHSFGMGRVPLGMLEPALRERLDYDAEEAAAWLAANRPALASSEDAVGDTGHAADAAGKKKLKQAAAKRSASAQTRQRYLADLNSIYASARALQADRNCCPVHRRYQLASWAEDAAKLKKRIALLPAD